MFILNLKRLMDKWWKVDTLSQFEDHYSTPYQYARNNSLPNESVNETSKK